jgi:hypothetical protein
MAADGKPRFAFSLALFEHAKDYLPIYRALVRTRGAAIGLGTIRKILCDLVDAELERIDAQSPTEIPRDLRVQFIVGGCMAMLTWWLDHGAVISPEKVDAMFRSMVSAGMSSLAP